MYVEVFLINVYFLLNFLICIDNKFYFLFRFFCLSVLVCVMYFNLFKFKCVYLINILKIENLFFYVM